MKKLRLVSDEDIINDIYDSEEYIEELVESDEISNEESGFMQGYLES